MYQSFNQSIKNVTRYFILFHWKLVKGEGSPVDRVRPHSLR